MLLRSHSTYVQSLCCNRWLDSALRDNDGGRCVHVEAHHFRPDVLLHTSFLGQDVLVNIVSEAVSRSPWDLQKDVVGSCRILCGCEYTCRSSKLSNVGFDCCSSHGSEVPSAACSHATT